MAVLTTAAFLSKWNSRFADNTTRDISEGDMREFAEDIKDSFTSVLGDVTVTSWLSPCIVATTANITLSGEQTIDGVLTSTSRVLVKNQTTQSQNGIYVSAAGAWSRSTDADLAAELEGAAVGVTQGTTQQNTVWLQTTDSITLGTSAIVWQQIGFGFTSGLTNSAANHELMKSNGTNAVSSAIFSEDGRLYGTSLHNNANPITGTTNQYVASGTYTISLTNVTNITSSIPSTFQFIRVGNVVTVSGAVDITASGSGATILGISLPVASALAGSNQCAGHGHCTQFAFGRVEGDATNDRAQYVYSSPGSGSLVHFIHFTYLIV